MPQEFAPQEKSPEVLDVPEVNPEAPLKIEQSTEVGPEPTIEKANKKLFALGTFVVISICLLTLGLVYMFFLVNRQETGGEQQIVNTTPTSTLEVQIFERSSVTFEVLNGSGITGEGKKLADKLEKLGYKVTKVGNHKLSAGSKLFISEDLEEFKTQILSDFKDLEIESAEKIDGENSARIIIGK